MFESDVHVQRSGSLPRDDSASLEPMIDTNSSGANDLAPPTSPLSRYSTVPSTSPLSRYSSVADTQQDEVTALGLEVSHSSPLLAGDVTGLSVTQLRRRHLVPRSTAPPGQSVQPLTRPEECTPPRQQSARLHSTTGMPWKLVPTEGLFQSLVHDRSNPEC